MPIETLNNNLDMKCDSCGESNCSLKRVDGDAAVVTYCICNNCGHVLFQDRKDKISIKLPPTVTCPFCQSTNCKKISGASKIGKVALFGLFAAGSVSKTWHCNNCGSNFG